MPPLAAHAVFGESGRFFCCCFFSPNLNALSAQRQADFDMVKWKRFALLPGFLGRCKAV